VARHGYAADAPFIDSPRDARYHYSKRFGIESSYRLFEQAIATTTNTRSTVRLLYVVVSLLLQNVWRYLHLRVCGDARRTVLRLTSFGRFEDRRQSTGADPRSRPV